MAIRETLEEAGYSVVNQVGNVVTLLSNDGDREEWVINDNHASYGISWNGHDLEFVCSVD